LLAGQYIDTPDQADDYGNHIACHSHLPGYMVTPGYHVKMQHLVGVMAKAARFETVLEATNQYLTGSSSKNDN
jgi:hypothetical protein